MPINPIREIVDKFLSQPSDLDSFVAAFSNASFNVHKSGATEAVKLANQVEACLADVRAGFISVAELPRTIKELLDPSAVGYYFTATSFSQTVNRPAVVEKGFPERRVAASGTSTGVVFGSANPLQV
jgi:hypothetical protein